MTEPPDLPAGKYRWPKETAPSARGLTAEEARAEMIAQMEKARDAAATAEVRAQAESMLDLLRRMSFGPDLRVVRDDGPESSDPGGMVSP